MTRSPSLEHQIMQVIRESTLASTNEVARGVNKAGENVGRDRVRKTLRSLEERGVLKNIGQDRDAWRLP